MSNTVEIIILAKVRAKIQLEDGETIEDVKKRNVDIYLHGQGENGHMTKVDLGGDAVITVVQ